MTIHNLACCISVLLPIVADRNIPTPPIFVAPPAGRAGGTELRLNSPECIAAANLTLRVGIDAGFEFISDDRLVWRVTPTPWAKPDFIDMSWVIKVAHNAARICRLPDAMADDPTQFYGIIFRSNKLSVRHKNDGSIEIVASGSPSGPSAAPAAAPRLNVQSGDDHNEVDPRQSAEIEALISRVIQLINDSKQIMGPLAEIERRLDSLTSYAWTIFRTGLSSLAFFVSVLTFTAVVALRRSGRRTIAREFRDYFDEKERRSESRNTDFERSFNETFIQLHQVESLLRCIRSEVQSLRSPAPAATTPERVPQAAPPPPDPVPQSEIYQPSSYSPAIRDRPASDDEWSEAYNAALKAQDLNGFAERFDGVWARMIDRNAWPARLIAVDAPPERGVLDGFLYVRNGESTGGWVFPGPNFYTARSAINSGQLRSEAFAGIFDSKNGDTYALRQPACAAESRSDITINRPGIIEL